MKKTIWDIKKGDKYYRLRLEGLIEEFTWNNTEYDRSIRNSFNAFLTRDEAEAELKRRIKSADESRPKPKLDDSEKRYLKVVIRPFRNRVKYISKSVRLSKKEEYIVIVMDDDYLHFPYFKIDTMYQGMELDKQYTLEELGL